MSKCLSQSAVRWIGVANVMEAIPMNVIIECFGSGAFHTVALKRKSQIFLTVGSS